MKKASSKFNKLINAIFAVLLAALGFSCSDDPSDVPCMYGTPHGDFEVKGTVVDENGKPVPNAKIALREGLKINGEIVWHDAEWYLNTTSDNTGTYSLKSSGMFNKVRIVCTPPDESLEADSIETKVDFKDDGRDEFWYIGKATVEQDFKLKAKKD